MSDILKGVAFNAPPPHLIADASRVIAQMTKDFPTGTRGAVVALATDAGVNAAVVHRVGNRFVVASWIGKTWTGKIEAGGAVQVTW